MKNGFKIRRLIKEFNNIDNEAGYAEMMFYKTKDKEEKEEYSFEIDYCESRQFDIGTEIKKLEPSKYMLDKYDELEHIISNYAY